MEYKSENNTYFTTTIQRNFRGEFEFCIWAPFADRMTVEIRNPKHEVVNNNLQNVEEWVKKWHIEAVVDDKKSTYIELKKYSDNCFRGKAPRQKAFNGDMYRFILEKEIKGQKIKLFRKDPRAICQPHIYSWSKLYDNKKYKWSANEERWQKHKIKERLSVKDKNLLQLNNFAYIEAHIPTATAEGTIDSFKKCVDEFAQQGFQGILLMPSEGTFDVNWGYDGVDKYAITRCWGKNYVTENVSNADKINDSLKMLVDYCHQKRINVGIDWVPSHITEEFGNILLDFAPYENVNKEQNSCAKEWGGFTFNLEGKPNAPISNEVKQVRRYITDIPLHLVETYHFDFIRGDQSPNMYSNITMKLVKAELDFHFPDTAVIWEDHRTNDGLTDPLSEKEIDNSSQKTHDETIENLMNNKASLRNIGGDEIWDFNFSHALEANILDKEVWPACPNVDFLFGYFQPHFKGTKYLLSHDEIGNHCGSRILTKYLAAKLNFANNPSPQVTRHCLSSDCAEKLLQLALYGRDTELTINEINQVLEFYFIKKDTVTPNLLKKVLEEAIAYDKLGHACVYLASGSKMVFQGENYGEINPFLFHRIQPADETAISVCKGYDIGKIGFYRSKLNPEKHFNQGIYNFFKDLNKLCKSGQFMTNDKIILRKVHNKDRIIVFERTNTDTNEHLLAILNFSTQFKLVEFCAENSVVKEYKPIINSDDIIYGGKTSKTENLIITNNSASKTMPPASVVVYKSV